MPARIARIAVTAVALVASGGIGLWTASAGFAEETSPATVHTDEDRRNVPAVVRQGDGPIIINPPDDGGPAVPSAPATPTDKPGATCPTCPNPSEAPSPAPGARGPQGR